MLSSGITNSPWSFTNTSANWLLRRAYTWFDSVFLSSLISNTLKGINLYMSQFHKPRVLSLLRPIRSCVCHMHLRTERSGLSNATFDFRRCISQWDYKNPSWVWGWDRKIRPEDHRLASRRLPRDDNRWARGMDFSIPILTRIVDSFSCSPLHTTFILEKLEKKTSGKA